MPKKARLTGIKSLRCYQIPEVAEVAGVSTRTVRTWIKQGLPAMAIERPALVRGDDLIAFIKKQRGDRKTDVALHEFFCLRCRQARSAAGGFATCRTTGTRVTLKAICIECELVMNKPVAKSHLSALRGKLDLIDED